MFHENYIVLNQSDFHFMCLRRNTEKETLVLKKQNNEKNNYGQYPKLQKSCCEFMQKKPCKKLGY